MRNRTLQATVIVLLVLAAAVWTAAAATPTARAASGGATAAVKSYTIPLASTAILQWTFTPAPTAAVKARFQISSDRKHWTTLKVVKVAKGTKRVRTTWKAAAHREVRYFRLDTAGTLSNLVRLRVR